MIQDKRIIDLTNEQRVKLYLYLHKKVFSADSQLVTSQRRENISDVIFHDCVMELLLIVLGDDTDTEPEGDSDSEEENVVLSRTPHLNKRVVFNRPVDTDVVYQKKDKN